MLALTSVVEETHCLIQVCGRCMRLAQGWIRQGNISVQEEVLGLYISVHDSALVDELELVELLRFFIVRLYDSGIIST